MNTLIESFFDPETNTVSYLLADPSSKACAVIDPVLDYDPDCGRITHGSADRIIAAIARHGLQLQHILETHAHADHLSAAQYLKSSLGGIVAIGRGIIETQKTFAARFNLKDLPADGRQFDRLLDDGATIQVGNLLVRALHTPGHTPACMAYAVEDAVFVGDTLFMPDYGTARTDFPGGDARTLYRSIRRILALPGATRLFLCHDYKTPSRPEFAWESTVANQRANNIHIRDGISEDAFVTVRQDRDKSLAAPRLLLPAIQFNIRAGHTPPPEDNGVTYLKIPLTVK